MNYRHLLMSMLIVSGCSSNQIQINPNIWDCPEEPLIGDIKTDYDFIAWVEDVRVAGDKCRNTLAIIKENINEIRQ